MPGYTARPYVSGGRLSDLVRDQGRTRADAELRRGDRSAQMWSSIGATVSGTMRDLIQQRQDAPRLADEAEARRLKLETAKAEAEGAKQASAQEAAFNERLSGWDGDPDTLQLVAVQTYGPQRGLEKAESVAKGLAALQSLRTKSFTDGRAVLRDVMGGLNDVPEAMRAQIYPSVRQEALGAGVITEQDAPPEYDPTWWKRTVNFGQQPAKPNLQAVDPTRPIVDMNTGATVRPGEPEAPKPGDSEWISRGGQPVQIPKGTAQPGDRPYQPPSQAHNAGQVGISPTMEANVINRLTTQWGKAVAPVADLSRQVKLMDAGMDAVKRGDRAQGSQVLLVTFQKILDPPSVVRESEYMRSAVGQSMMNRVKGAFDKLQRGGAGVTTEELQKFAVLAREAAQAQASGYVDAQKERIGKTADRFKIPRDLVFEDYSFAEEMKTEPAKPASGKKKIGRFEVEVEP